MEFSELLFIWWIFWFASVVSTIYRYEYVLRNKKDSAINKIIEDAFSHTMISIYNDLKRRFAKEYFKKRKEYLEKARKFYKDLFDQIIGIPGLRKYPMKLTRHRIHTLIDKAFDEAKEQLDEEISNLLTEETNVNDVVNIFEKIGIHVKDYLHESFSNVVKAVEEINAFKRSLNNAIYLQAILLLIGLITVSLISFKKLDLFYEQVLGIILGISSALSIIHIIVYLDKKRLAMVKYFHEFECGFTDYISSKLFLFMKRIKTPSKNNENV